MRTLFILFFSAVLIIPVYTQEIENEISVIGVEKELHGMFNILYELENSSIRDSINNEIIKKFSAVLETWDGFHYQWKLLERIGNVISEDKKLRIVTWYLEMAPGKYEYYGLLSYQLDKKQQRKYDSEYRVVELKDNSEKIKQPAKVLLEPDSWFGCVFYSIETFTHRRDTWYSLIGYDFNDGFSSKKLIEVVTFDPNGRPVFGASFINEKENLEYHRLIFEYSSKLAMSLNYDNRLNMYVHDHLSPFEPFFRGSYRFYGPDGSYDGVKFDKGRFYIVEDVDARNF